MRKTPVSRSAPVSQATNDGSNFLASAKFLYTVTLEMPWSNEHFPKRLPVPLKAPTILSPKEVNTFFTAVAGVKHRAVLMVCYGAGLRIGEAVALKIADIDSQRMVLRIENGKGGDERFALLSPRLLAVLRTYFRILRPVGDYLFPSWRASRESRWRSARWCRCGDGPAVFG